MPVDIAEPEGKALILPGTICKAYNLCMAKEDLSLVYDRDMIDARVATLATEITREYKNLNPILISVLKGSVIFFSDLIRRLDFGIELDFIRLASYGPHTKTSGEVNIIYDVTLDIEGRHVLLVEDIIDTGLTVKKALDHLNKRGPASIKLCVLIDKPWQRLTPVEAAYTGFTAPDRFLVGYGLDYAEHYRNLPEIYALEK